MEKTELEQVQVPGSPHDLIRTHTSTTTKTQIFFLQTEETVASTGAPTDTPAASLTGTAAASPSSGSLYRTSPLQSFLPGRNSPPRAAGGRPVGLEPTPSCPVTDWPFGASLPRLHLVQREDLDLPDCCRVTQRHRWSKAKFQEKFKKEELQKKSETLYKNEQENLPPVAHCEDAG